MNEKPNLKAGIRRQASRRVSASTLAFLGRKGSFRRMRTLAVLDVILRPSRAATLAVCLFATDLVAESPVDWRYTLLPSSQLVDDCYCGRPTLLLPLRGTFDLKSQVVHPLFVRYAVTNIAWEASTGGGTAYKIRGHGWYEVGGEVAVVQTMALDLQIDNGFTNRPCSFTNSNYSPGRLWPMLQVHLDETNQAVMQFYRLDLDAAPFHELWFSTANGFTPGIWPPFTEHVSGGDLVSSTGRVVKRNHELTRQLGIMPMVPDLGLDALEMLPGGEIAFSVEDDIFSETLGPLHHGDLLSNRGRVVTAYDKLSGAFGPEPPPANQGLDAVQVLANGELYFSVEQDFFSEALGRTIRKGDLLSSLGVVIRSNEELIAQFQPADPKQDYGLDALYVWPGGEIWFSVENGFHGPHFENYGPGDLLSDQGYVVYRNLDLMQSFQPLEDLADFGLDSLFIISDADIPESSQQRPESTGVAIAPGGADLLITWKAGGRVFQLERAPSIVGPWEPISPIQPEPPVLDAGALTNAPQSFYRLRQW